MSIFKRLFVLAMSIALFWPMAVSAAGQPATTAQAAGPASSPAEAALASQSVGTGEYLQVFLGLFVVVGLIAVLAWAARRFGRFNVAGAGALRIVGGLSMGQRERVVLVQVGEQQLLLGVAPGRVQTLHVLEQPIRPAERQAGTGGSTAVSFAERLSAALKRGPRA